MDRRRKMKMISVVVVVMVVMVVIMGNCVTTIDAQQSYVNNHQLDCYNNYNVTDGYDCNARTPSCLSYLTFRPIIPYNTPAAIARLLSSDAASIVAANNISSSSSAAIIPPDIPLVMVPVNCSCNKYQLHQASYEIRTLAETYLSMANNTYQGLTTCQALIALNPLYDSRNLTPGITLRVPLRCACPTPRQAASGVKFLLSYLVTWGDNVPSVSSRFGVQDPQSVRDANRLSTDDIVYPFTTLLIPLDAPPRLSAAPPPPPTTPPQPETTTPPPPPSSSKKWVIIGSTIGVALFITAAAVVLFVFLCSSRKRESKSALLPPTTKDDYSTIPVTTLSSSWSHSSQGFRSAVDSLTVYTIEKLQEATGSFGEENKISGSVFRGSFKGDTAAVKVMKGNVSAEMSILKRVNHSNIIRLSGFCVHDGNTYLVYEYAESGSLNDCLASTKPGSVLGWKQRVEIAHGVADALNYLHNFVDPPYVHSNLTSRNVLLDASWRAKLSNFKLARSSGDVHLTKHVVGTQGYMAPEYIENGLVSPKVDVFAFGIVLLELLSGRKATTSKNNTNGEVLLSDSIRRVLEGDDVRQKFREFVDPALKTDYPLDLAFSMAQLANSCVSLDLNARPEISQVLLNLSKIQSSTSDWDPSDDLDRSKSLSLGR